jgi:hypothetical protein
MVLKVQIAELGIYNRLSRAEADRVPPADIAFAQKSDVDPDDVGSFRLATVKYGLIVIIRCPKRGAVAWHGIFKPKTMEDGKLENGGTVKSGISGIGWHPEKRNVFISDYDMMSMWRRVDGGGYRKVNATNIADSVNADGTRIEAGEVKNYVEWINGQLRSPLQHGAQDDYVPPAGKGHMNVAADCRCAAFQEGEAIYLPDREATRSYYVKMGLQPWPYDRGGVYIRPENRAKFNPWGLPI